MKDRLNQLTAAQFFDLACGDTSVLRPIPASHIPRERLAKVSRDIIFEYRKITDSAGANAYLATAEEIIKARIISAMCTICLNLIRFNQHHHVRDIIHTYGIDTDSIADEKLVSEVQSLLGRAKSTIERNDADTDCYGTQHCDTVRKLFDEQTAALMAYYKFQIDPATMQASVYAHLVSRYNREIKAQLAAIKNR